MFVGFVVVGVVGVDVEDDDVGVLGWLCKVVCRLFSDGVLLVLWVLSMLCMFCRLVVLDILGSLGRLFSILGDGCR